ncbi:hypothetical protein VC83_00048 [Pseudogymnoascus destructans]|uniref:N-acetyltransferase domain-containing protein n=2 Tax=Pseudogymnoascus destructans TaxID=655981 RepID=L8G5L3_PSED2|nr:uncharacterized protein VC83_00048 [Pseudogymnoascus destructans]ELR07968.1 hypothetical protein GMDG_02827 [Pseudogymnoascus destructans 20631-21]OAF63284.1 hypothetical protein VC83_00048 [Pseudogymnoascus destructans]
MDNKTLPPPTQSSIRSFFKPKSPSYALPPSINPPKGLPTTSVTAPPPSPLPQSATSTPPPPPPASTTAQQPPAPTTATTATTKPIHPQATISPILPSHIPALKRINALLLCITYPDSFYTRILAPSPTPSFSRAILWSTSPSQTTPSATPPTLVGGVVCRLEPSPATGGREEGSEQQIYIQSLALLSPYRHLGLASAALSSIITSIVSAPLSPPITSLYAHVWTENTEGLEWYKARGFEVEGGAVGGYYRRLSPDTAWVLRRRLGARDYLEYGSSGAGASAATNGGVVLGNRAPPPPPQGNGNKENRRPPPKTGNSYQTMGPGMEWNDLPTDILLPVPPRQGGGNGSGVDGSGPPSSAVSSRSSSVVGGKKKRVYPAAAFGS